MTDDQPSKAERRQRYERLLDIVARNVGDPQPPTCAARTLWQIVGESSLERDPTMLSVCRAAVDNDHLLRFTDAAGRGRYALTTDGIEAAPHDNAPLFEPADESALDDLIQRQVDSADVNQQVIAWANQRKAAIQNNE